MAFSFKTSVALPPHRKGREPFAASVVLSAALGSRNKRALILGWAYYLDAFSSYPLRTWLPSVYRSEPSPRTALMGEQPNPWNILQPQVAKSRHRAAKPSRRCELLGEDQPVIPRVTFIR